MYCTVTVTILWVQLLTIMNPNSLNGKQMRPIERKICIYIQRVSKYKAVCHWFNLTLRFVTQTMFHVWWVHVFEVMQNNNNPWLDHNALVQLQSNSLTKPVRVVHPIIEVCSHQCDQACYTIDFSYVDVFVPTLKSYQFWEQTCPWPLTSSCSSYQLAIWNIFWKPSKLCFDNYIHHKNKLL